MLRHGRRRVAVTLQDGAQGFNIDHTANPNGIPEHLTAHPTLWRARLRFRDCRVGLRYRGTFSIPEQLISRNVVRFRGGLVFKAHGWLCHATLGSRIIMKKKRRNPVARKASLSELPCGLQGNLAHKKQHLPGTLQYDHDEGPLAVLGRWAVSCE